MVITSLLTASTLALSSAGASASRRPLMVIPRSHHPRPIRHPRPQPVVRANGAYRITAITPVELPPTGATDQASASPTSQSISSLVLSKEVPRVLSGAPVETVTGASFTSSAFEKSLQGAIAKYRRAAVKNVTELGTTVPVTNCKRVYATLPNGTPENGIACLGSPTEFRYGVLRLRVSFVSG
ncbi:MAG TPA: hypothetical protein VNE42_06215 [Acidimicrobiales bacterium]|nr:hypothetical protein [Acidimicrobiales bacterium]